MAKLIEMKPPHDTRHSRVLSTVCAKGRRTEGRNVISVMSITGGAGKTSLVANLGRALAHQGRRAFLIDTAPYGLLPFHLGATEARPGRAQTVSDGACDDLRLMSLSIPKDYASADEGAWMERLLQRETLPAEYVLIDISTSPTWLTRQILRLSQFVLIPLMPDMSTLLSLGCIEGCLDAFCGAKERERPSYFAVLNQFASGISFHRRVAEEVRTQLGSRLIPTTLCRDTRIGQSLPGERNWMERYPASPLVSDYRRLTLWMKTQVEGISSEVADR
jgi:cellulose synthase operon protein YhjQ